MKLEEFPETNSKSQQNGSDIIFFQLGLYVKELRFCKAFLTFLDSLKSTRRILTFPIVVIAANFE